MTTIANLLFSFLARKEKQKTILVAISYPPHLGGKRGLDGELAEITIGLVMMVGITIERVMGCEVFFFLYILASSFPSPILDIQTFLSSILLPPC